VLSAAAAAAAAAADFAFKGRVEADSQPPNRKRRIDEVSGAEQLPQLQASPEFQHMQQAASAVSTRQMVANHRFRMDYSSAVFPVAGGLNHSHHGLMDGLAQPHLAGALGLPFPGAHAAMLGPSVDQLQCFPGAHILMQLQAAAMAQFQQEQAEKRHLSTKDASLLGMEPLFPRIVCSQNGIPDAVPPDDDDDDDMPPDVTSS
jgi:hypothetical protein